MAPTPPKEIARQHEEALRMVRDGMPCIPSTYPKGCEIPLSDKIRPTAERFASSNKNEKEEGKEEEKKENSSNETENLHTSNNKEDQDQEQQVVVDLECPSCYSTLGHVDVSALQALVRQGYNEKYALLAPSTPSSTTTTSSSPSPELSKEAKVSSPPPKNPSTTMASPSISSQEQQSISNYWDPQNAAIHNVSITRPSHDAWGINKIVLIFCDDFIHKIYHLPWWWQQQQTNLKKESGGEGGGNDCDDSGTHNKGCTTTTTTTTTTNPFQDAIQPILDLLPPQHILIRLLLASLPPGVTIPVHHDTGEWVKQTHRVHVPVMVKDPSQVLFRCGITPDTMQRIDCTPGHVFELNNQAKHAVSNCSDTGECRVHLILDYIVVDPPQNPSSSSSSLSSSMSKEMMPYYGKLPKSIVQLEPGEQLIQSRRSIDRYRDIIYHPRPSPTFMILGAQKSGTTSLYEYIMQHPWVVRPTRRETHCLDWRWPPHVPASSSTSSSSSSTSSGVAAQDKNSNNKIQTNTSSTTTTTATNSDMTKDQILEHIRTTYFHGTKLQQYPSCMTGDSTPSYLLDSRRVIPRIKEIFGEWCNNEDGININNPHHHNHQGSMKFFVMLRDPVARAKSHYAMVTSNKGSPAQLKTRGMEWRNLSFSEVVTMELQILHDCGLIPYWDINTGRCDDKVFTTFCDSPQEERAWDKYLQHHVPLQTGSYGILTRGLYALQLRPWFRSFDENQFLVLQLEQDLNRTKALSTTMDKVWDHLDLPRFPVKDDTPRNTREYDPLEEDMKQYLERFFQPHNRRLAKLLGDEWNNVWGCQEESK